jgi:hypothetical protein
VSAVKTQIQTNRLATVRDSATDLTGTNVQTVLMTHTIPARQMVRGTMFEVRASGTYVSGGAGNLSFNLRMIDAAGDSLWTHTPFDPAIATLFWDLSLFVVVRSMVAAAGLLFLTTKTHGTLIMATEAGASLSAVVAVTAATPLNSSSLHVPRALVLTGLISAGAGAEILTLSNGYLRRIAPQPMSVTTP